MSPLYFGTPFDPAQLPRLRKGVTERGDRSH
jgi:hypothetical protein